LNQDLWKELDDPALVVGDAKFKVAFAGPDRHPPTCHSVHQVHGICVVEAGAETAPGAETLKKADGLFTTQPGVSLGIKTADCLPVVLVSRSMPWLSVLHAGWRGLFAGILHEAVNIFRELGGDARDLCMVTGPCISQACFEVGPELVEALHQTCLSETQKERVLMKGKGDRWHVDLSVVAAFQALHEGTVANNVQLLRSCTYSSPSLWNSYRRTGQASPSNWTFASL